MEIAIIRFFSHASRVSMVAGRVVFFAQHKRFFLRNCVA